MSHWRPRPKKMPRLPLEAAWHLAQVTDGIRSSRGSQGYYAHYAAFDASTLHPFFFFAFFVAASGAVDGLQAAGLGFATASEVSWSFHFFISASN
jgi:hypothetical protein